MTLTSLRPWTPRTVESLPVDQARSLRALLERRDRLARSITAAPAGQCCTWSITSGKGGVGKSVVALNLAVALAERNLRVGLLDANLGIGNLDLLCGLNGYWNLTHVVAGSRELSEVCLSGPAGVQILPGASALLGLTTTPEFVQQQVLSQLQAWESGLDVLLIDTGSGLHQLVRQLSAASDQVLVLTTPEPTALADAYATIKALQPVSTAEFSVMVNQATVEQTERILERIDATMKLYLRTHLKLGSGIPFDAAIPQSVRRRLPLLQHSSTSEAARGIRAFADKLASQPPNPQAGGFFARLWSGLQGTPRPGAASERPSAA